MFVGLAPTSADSNAAPRASKQATAISLTMVTKGRIISGSKVAFTGKAPKALRGKRVKLERRVGAKGAWVRVGGGKVAANGAFRASGIATGFGAVSFRAVGKVKKKIFASRAVGSQVYAWFNLADQNYVDTQGMDIDSIQMGGVSYGNSPLGGLDFAGDVDWIDYNLGYHCSTFQASIGISDNADTGTQGEFYLTRDAERQLLGAKALGAATLVSQDVAGRLRIRLETVGTGSPVGDAGFGNARILCKANPSPQS